MTSILRIDSSVSGDASVTNRLSSLLIETLGNDATVVHRDVTQIPSLSAASFAANGTPTTERSDEQAQLAQLGDDAIAELEQAGVLVIAAPIYNFGIPSGLKAWIDLIARAGRTFQYTETGAEGLVAGKKAYIVTASGGVPIGSEADFATPHIQQFLQFLGFTDITVIGAGSLMTDPNTLDNAEAQIRELATV